MRKNIFFIIVGIVAIVLLGNSCGVKKPLPTTSQLESTELNELSQDFLQRLRDGKSTDEIQNKLTTMTVEEIASSFTNDEQRIAFWVNIYNAFIQVKLTENPSLYEDRRDFFSRDQIDIAGETVSFEVIEHGIIRRSQWSFGLGYIRKLFSSKFERKLRVKSRDYRVHFALNCGAKDCPPVAIYNPIEIDAQFSKSGKMFLDKSFSLSKPRP